MREKKINPEKWAAGEPRERVLFHILAFQKLGRIAYEQRYLFFFNQWRRAYPLSEVSPP
ncbi:MAG: hypothetical protein RMK19_08730 [Bacteroidia bacterium]|nr:hypothetical protein [Bacteroidia bacterium]MDW8016079.1 hypothetical protein [Bacteroidia bacterium]